MNKKTSKIIELIFHAQNLQGGIYNQDPYLKIFSIDNDISYKQIGTTEPSKKNPNPQWTKTFKIEFIFNKKQDLRFEVWDKNSLVSDKLIGTAETTLGYIIAKQSNNCIIELIDNRGNQVGNLCTRIGNIGSNCVQWTWEGVNLKNMDIFSKSDPFLMFYYLNNDQKVFVKETEYIKNNNDPKWQRFETSLDLLCKNDLNKEFLIEVIDWEQNLSNKNIGSVKTTLQWMLNHPEGFLQLEDQKGKPAGILKYNDLKIIKPGFIDYLIGGQQIKIISAIDYTASNGLSNNPDSLHFSDQQKNQYLVTLKAFCNVLIEFSIDRKISLYGFGGIPQFFNLKKQNTDHCFPITGNTNKDEVDSVESVIQTYLRSFNFITLSEPKYIQEILKKAIENAKSSQNKNIYTILLILTNGDIEDLKESKLLLSQAKELPLSIIIVGVGPNKFFTMKELEESDVKKNTGDQQQTNCCKFIKFTDFNYDNNQLIEQILTDIPNQLSNYKTKEKISI